MVTIGTPESVLISLLEDVLIKECSAVLPVCDINNIIILFLFLSSSCWSVPCNAVTYNHSVSVIQYVCDCVYWLPCIFVIINLRFFIYSVLKMA